MVTPLSNTTKGYDYAHKYKYMQVSITVNRKLHCGNMQQIPQYPYIHRRPTP